MLMEPIPANSIEVSITKLFNHKVIQLLQGVPKRALLSFLFIWSRYLEQQKTKEVDRCYF